MERSALEELRNDQRIIIKEADKGGALVIMDRTFYKDKMILKDHLDDSTRYQKIEGDAEKSTVINLKKLIEKYDQCTTKNEKQYILNYEWSTSEFYVRPKIHKCESIIEAIKKDPKEVMNISDVEDLEGRPIVAGMTSPTRHLSDLIGRLLQIIVPKQKSYVKDDWNFLRQLPNHINNKSKLFGCDIKSLYTSIPHDLGLKAMDYWLNRHRQSIPPRFTTNFILEAIDFLLTNNIFKFIEQSYKQLTGTAMGASFASFYACLTIGFLEETILLPELSTKFSENTMMDIIAAYKRFMDDGIVFLPSMICENSFLQRLNAMNENIIFTLEPSSRTVYEGKPVESLNFLDITIIKHVDGYVETDIYYKSTNAHDYLHYDSFHPAHIIKNIPYNLAKRIIVFVKNEERMNFRLNQLNTWLLKCKYPQEAITKGFHNAKLQGPAPQKSKKEVITYVHPHMSNFSFNSIIATARDMLLNSKDENIKSMFSNTRVVQAIKQPKSIIRLLSVTSFTESEANSRVIDQSSPGLFAECGDSRCRLCHGGYIQQCSSFITSNNTTWEIKSHINCNSKNVLYFLKCNMCKTPIIETKTGKTWTRFRERLNNHISDCRTGRTTDIFDLHVHRCGTKNKCLVEPFFKVYAYMKLSKPDKLITYEKYLHSKGFDTMNN